MASQKDVRAIALSLPGVREAEDRFAFSVDHKGKARGFAWAWNERVDPKKPRVARADVLAVRVAGADDKAALLAADGEKFFTEPHYNGFPAVLVRLPAVSRGELRALLAEAHRAVAPPAKAARAAPAAKAAARRRSPRR